MRYVDGQLLCDVAHAHNDMIELIWCEGGRRSVARSEGREALVALEDKTVYKHEGVKYRACPAGQWHEVDDARNKEPWRVVRCGGVLRHVRQTVEHEGKEWVVVEKCRHLHKPSEVVDAVYCDHALT